MKIAIFTYYNGCNFGAQLQAYTSSHFFESLGHEVWIVNFANGDDTIFSKYPNEQVEAHKRFVDTKLHLTPKLQYDEILPYIQSNHFDVIAFGADAIWNKRNRENLWVFTAQWLNDIKLDRDLKVIAISPAFMGNTYSDLTEEEHQSFKKGLENFTFINARDSWTKDVVNREIMGGEYIKLLNPDPVFLLDQLCDEPWDNMCSSIAQGSYYLITLPNNLRGWERKRTGKWLRKMSYELHKKGYKLVELPLPEGRSGFDEFDFIVPYPIDPLQWFLWLKNAKAFIGLRFHAVVSCISAGTPFYSLDVYGHVPRWLNYLNRLGFHKWDRKYNVGSKIRNLLEGSNLEQYRIHGVTPNSLTPKRMVETMENFDMNSLVIFKEKNVETFVKNMKTALS